MTAGSFRGRPPAPSTRKPCEKCKKKPAMAGKKQCTGCIRSSPGAMAGGSGARPDNPSPHARSRGVGR
jgi:hypothetical protein